MGFKFFKDNKPTEIYISNNSLLRYIARFDPIDSIRYISGVSEQRIETLPTIYDENTFDRIQSYVINNEYYRFKWNSSNNLTIISGTHSITHYFITYHSTLPNFFRNNRGNEIFVESISRMGIDRVYHEGDIMEDFLYNDILTINAIIL